MSEGTCFKKRHALCAGASQRASHEATPRRPEAALRLAAGGALVLATLSQLACAALIDARGDCSTQDARRLLHSTRSELPLSQVLDSDFNRVWSDPGVPWVLDGHFQRDRVLLVAPGGSFSVHALSGPAHRPALTASFGRPLGAVSFNKSDGDDVVLVGSAGRSTAHRLDDLFAGVIQPRRVDATGSVSCFAPSRRRGEAVLNGRAGAAASDPVLEIAESPSGEHLAVISPGPCNARYKSHEELTSGFGHSCGDELLLHVDIVEAATCDILAASDIDYAHDWASEDRFIASVEGKMWRWDPRAGATSSSVAVPELTILRLSPDDTRIVGGSEHLVVWIDLSTGKQAHLLVAPECAKISALRYSERGHTLAAFVPASLPPGGI